MKRNIAPRGLLAAALLGAFGAASAQTPSAPHCASIQSTKPEVCIPDWTTRSPSYTGTAAIPGAASRDTTIVVPPAASPTSTTGTLSGATVSSDTNTTLGTSSTTPRTPTSGTPSTSSSTNLTVNPSVNASGRSMNSSPSSSIDSRNSSATMGSAPPSTSGGFFRPSDTTSLNGTTSGTPTPSPAGTATPGSLATPDTSSITGTMPR